MDIKYVYAFTPLPPSQNEFWPKLKTYYPIKLELSVFCFTLHTVMGSAYFWWKMKSYVKPVSCFLRKLFVEWIFPRDNYISVLIIGLHSDPQAWLSVPCCHISFNFSLLISHVACFVLVPWLIFLQNVCKPLADYTVPCQE